MTTRTVERIEEWDSSPFTGGFHGLHDLADQEFSGIVEVGTARCCLSMGRVVGVLGGTMDDFAQAEGTVYEAPSPALPLLALMQERSEEVRAKYYTEDTPLREVDQTLSDGGFTGYVELSENVLSGDYYVVYHGGRSSSVAFVGEAERLETGDEAFETAAGEVGIYEVRPAEIDVVEIPEPEGPAPGATGSGDEGAPDDAAATPGGQERAQKGETDAAADEEAETDAAADEEAETDAPMAWDEEPGGAADTDADSEAPDDGAGAGADSDESSGVDSDAADDADGTSENEPAASGSESADQPEETERVGQDGDPARTGPAESTESATPTEAEGRPSASESTGPSAGGEGATGGRPTEPSTDRSQRRDSPRTTGRPGDRSNQAGPSTGPAGADQARDRGSGAASQGSIEPDDLEIRTLPSIDPARSGTGRDPDPAPPSRETAGTTTDRSTPGAADTQASRGAQPTQDTDPGRPGAENRADAGASRGQPTNEESQTDPATDAGDAAGDLREALEAKEQKVASLEERLETVESERDELSETKADLEDELERVRSERDDLEERIEDLEREVETLERKLEVEDVDVTGGDRELTPSEALSGTNLFVRYESKGQPTLEKAHDGEGDREAVNRNLNLEYHTEFEAGDAAVGGEPFDAFLEDTLEFQFVDWLVHDLLYEIQDTGQVAGMRDLYDALPKVDRAELNGTVTTTVVEDGEEVAVEETFDVVVRDRMGDPLVVANLNDSRIAASETTMTSLITAASRVRESNEPMAGAFLVTRSFFEPEALEAAAEATDDGLLSRDKRRSYVKLSRKTGFHLCLAEARNDEFYLTVPEL